MKIIMYYHDQAEIEKGIHPYEENYKGKLNGKLVRILRYKEKEIMDNLYDWIPTTERSLITFLSQHPKKISENAELIGLEIFNIDILFEDSNNMYVVEAKRNNGSSEAVVINNAISQLERYCNVIEQQDTNKKIVPIVAIIDNRIKEREKRKRKTIERNKEREIIETAKIPKTIKGRIGRNWKELFAQIPEKKTMIVTKDLGNGATVRNAVKAVNKELEKVVYSVTQRKVNEKITVYVSRL